MRTPMRISLKRMIISYQKRLNTKSDWILLRFASNFAKRLTVVTLIWTTLAEALEQSGPQYGLAGRPGTSSRWRCCPARGRQAAGPCTSTRQRRRDRLAHSEKWRRKECTDS